MFRSQKSANLKRSKSPATASVKPLSKSTKGCISLFRKQPSLTSQIPLSSSACILSTKFSGDGQYVLCSTNEGVVDVLQVKKSGIKIFKSMSCHKRVVDSINWGHSKHLWLSGGQDEFAFMWSCSSQNQDPILTFGLTSLGEKHFMKKLKQTSFPGFEDGVSNIQFYCLDQFVMLSSKNSMYLFKYEIGLKESTLGRSSNSSYCELAATLPMEYATITAMAAVNQYFSNLLICAGSPKCLDVIDMNVLKAVWHVESVSNRPVYLIGLNEGSSLWEQPQCMYDIFFTCSLTDGIKLWDLRSRRPVLTYCEHKCRSIPCEALFSACGRHIVTGSEDKSVYIYDLRSLSNVCKLSLQSDIITSASVSPSNDLLLASALDGCLYAFT